MELNELISKPLSEILNDCDVVSVKPISDPVNGKLFKLIIEYVPKTTKETF